MTAPVIEQQLSEEISMTVPVMESESESISMTTPVTSTQKENGIRIVQFTMPSKYTLETLPKPDNDEVQLREVSARKVATLRFTGFATESKVSAKKEELLLLLEKDNIDYV